VERLLQYLDDLEDLIFAVPLIAEQIRRAIQRILFLLGSALLQVGCVILALVNPPLALAVVVLMMVGLLHRAAMVRIPQTLTSG
jgi:hypothetical protein